jgi:hypothetical protein
MQVTSGAVGTFRFENVSVPEQPLKLCPTEIVVRISSADTANVMDVPCAVAPFHSPTLSDEADGDVGPLPHAEARSPTSVPTHKIAFVRVTMALNPWQLLFRFHTARVLCVRSFRPANGCRSPAARARQDSTAREGRA